jgi:hypothetical protein
MFVINKYLNINTRTRYVSEHRYEFGIRYFLYVMGREVSVTQAILRPRKELPWRVGMAVLEVSLPLPTVVLSFIRLKDFVVSESYRYH